jgi:hypothetical protein
MAEQSRDDKGRFAGGSGGSSGSFGKQMKAFGERGGANAERGLANIGQSAKMKGHDKAFKDASARANTENTSQSHREAASRAKAAGEVATRERQPASEYKRAHEEHSEKAADLERKEIQSLGDKSTHTARAEEASKSADKVGASAKTRDDHNRAFDAHSHASTMHGKARNEAMRAGKKDLAERHGSEMKRHYNAAEKHSDIADSL